MQKVHENKALAVKPCIAEILQTQNAPNHSGLCRTKLDKCLSGAGVKHATHATRNHFCHLDLSPSDVHISPKSIPNSEKQKQLPNTQWMKYVYCPALFTLEVGRASCNHGTNTVWKKRFSKSVCDTVANMPEARAKGSLPKELLSASLFTSST